MQPKYSKLEQNICDGVKEGQIKLGFDNETVRLYYPVTSLEAILGIKVKDEEEMLATLQYFKEQVAPRLGEVEVSYKGDRFCIGILPKGTSYIHEYYPASPFLVDLIERVRKPMCTLEDVLAIFHQYSQEVVCKPGDHIDFDYVIYFEDSLQDDYCYCFKFDEFHATYHRFTKFDFEDLMAH